MATLLVIGASRGIGLETVRRALAAGHRVRAFARGAAAIPVEAAGPGEGCRRRARPAAVTQAGRGRGRGHPVAGQRATAPQSILGGTTIFSQATRILVDAMRATGVRRLVAVTGLGAGDSRGHGGFLYDALIFPLVLKRIYDDKDVQEQMIKASGLEWTIVRPGLLTSGPATGQSARLDRSQRSGVPAPSAAPTWPNSWCARPSSAASSARRRSPHPMTRACGPTIRSDAADDLMPAQPRCDRLRRPHPARQPGRGAAFTACCARTCLRPLEPAPRWQRQGRALAAGGALRCGTAAPAQGQGRAGDGGARVPQRAGARRPADRLRRQRGRHTLGRGHARAAVRRGRDAGNARPRPRPGSAPAGRPFTAARPAGGMALDDDRWRSPTAGATGSPTPASLRQTASTRAPRC